MLKFLNSSVISFKCEIDETRENVKVESLNSLTNIVEAVFSCVNLVPCVVKFSLFFKFLSLYLVFLKQQ